MWRTATISRKLNTRTILTITKSFSQQNQLSTFTFINANSLQETPTLHIARKFSSPQDLRLPLLSDVEEYVQRDFTFSELQKKHDEENLPATVTMQGILDECETLAEVLEELQRAILGGKLWADELTLFYSALVRMKEEICKITSDEEALDPGHGYLIKPNLQKLHDNPYFQFLIRETLTHAPNLTTHDLTLMLFSFMQLQIPQESNTMLMLVAVIQNRINELFPRDVLHCLSSMRKIEWEKTPHFVYFRKGLIMHLENQIADEPTLRKVLNATSVTDRLRLTFLIRDEASSDLQRSILHSVIRTIRSRKNGGDLWNLYEVDHVLILLSKARLASLYLLGRSIRYLLDNPHEVKDRQKVLLSRISTLPWLENFTIPPHLLTQGDVAKVDRNG